jgi:transcriptional regulator with XRE-family HTH domain
MSDDTRAPDMTGDELKAARQAMGYSLLDLAYALKLKGADGDGDDQRNARDTIRRMESGSKPISGPIELAVRCLRDHCED